MQLSLDNKCNYPLYEWIDLGDLQEGLHETRFANVATLEPLMDFLSASKGCGMLGSSLVSLQSWSWLGQHPKGPGWECSMKEWEELVDDNVLITVALNHHWTSSTNPESWQPIWKGLWLGWGFPWARLIVWRILSHLFH